MNPQIKALIRSLLQIVGALLVAHGATNVGGALSAEPIVELVGGAVSTLVGIWLSHKKASEIPVVAVPTGVTHPDGSTEFIVRPANATVTKDDPTPKNLVEVQPTTTTKTKL